MDGPLSIRDQELTVVSETCCGPQQRNLAPKLYADLSSIKAQALAKELSERFTPLKAFIEASELLKDAQRDDFRVRFGGRARFTEADNRVAEVSRSLFAQLTAFEVDIDADSKGDPRSG